MRGCSLALQVSRQSPNATRCPPPPSHTPGPQLWDAIQAATAGLAREVSLMRGSKLRDSQVRAGPAAQRAQHPGGGGRAGCPPHQP